MIIMLFLHVGSCNCSRLAPLAIVLRALSLQSFLVSNDIVMVPQVFFLELF